MALLLKSGEPVQILSLQKPIILQPQHAGCCSPATSTPIRHVKQKKEDYATGEDSDNVNEIEDEKEQCSPVSVLDPFFEDDGHESVDAAEEDDCDLNCSYGKIERAKQKLLNWLRRFEELAALDPMELELKLLEGSDGEYQRESVESEDDVQLLLCRKQGANTSSLQHYPRKMSAEMKRLVSDMIVEEKSKILFSGNKEECDIFKMVELDLKREFEGWKKYPEEMEETAAEVELAILGVLVEEL